MNISNNLNAYHTQMNRFENVATNYENMDIAEAATEMSTSKALVEVNLEMMNKTMEMQEEVMNIIDPVKTSNRLNEVY